MSEKVYKITKNENDASTYKLIGELIQCERCKHYSDGFCGYINGLTGAVEKEDYCSRGEKDERIQ